MSELWAKPIARRSSVSDASLRGMPEQLNRATTGESERVHDEGDGKAEAAMRFPGATVSEALCAA